MRTLRSLIPALLILIGVAVTQSPQVPSTPSDSATSQVVPTLRVQVDDVRVEVVVRDKQGHAVGNLTQDDFEILDNNSPQSIRSFRVDSANKANPATGSTSESSAPAPASVASAGAKYPTRFAIYLVDDLHLQASDLIPTKSAIEKHWTKLRDEDRAALFTTSGKVMQDFTSARAELLTALRKIQLGTSAFQLQSCPWMNYYLADRIANRNDQSALSRSVRDTIMCAHLDGLPNASQIAEQMIRGAAQAELATGDYTTRITLGLVRDSIRRLTTTSGKRLIVLASPGFHTFFDQTSTESELMDFALRSQVVINTIDVRGVATDPTFDVALGYRQLLTDFVRDSARSSSDVLGDLAYGTGGTYFHNSNNLEEGFDRAAELPEYSYLLAYSAAGLKHDGKFHTIKVNLRSSKADDRRSHTVLARKGYFDAKPSSDPAQLQKEKIDAAMFSVGEISDLPITIGIQTTEKSPDKELSVYTRVALKELAFAHDKATNNDSLIFVSGIFDQNGRLLQGEKRNVDLKLKDESFADPTRGIFAKIDFLLKPGKYRIRSIVFDTRGQKLGAGNKDIEIQ